ncbi:MAG: c-type cytochrome biogenesis protein CcmI [Methylocella sp.]
MLWLIFALLTGAAVLSILWPLARAPRGLSRGAIDVAFYKAQLAEIDRDAAQGLVAESDAEGAKAEAGRRLLAVADAPSQQAAAATPRKARFASVAALVFVPALALGLYGLVGHPGLPDLPLSARLQASPGRMDLMAAVAKIEAHLAQNPDDGRGYEILAPVYLRIGRADDAVRAYAAALRLLGETPKRLTSYGEALVAAAGGLVTPDAKRAFETAAANDASAATPRFFLGLSAEQNGDAAHAREIWEKLLITAPADAAWAPGLRQHLAAMAGSPDAAAPSGGPPEGPAANPALAAKLEAMPDADRSSAIHGMVEGLATRLAQNGQDVEGWLRLVRAYAVLHEGDKARSALIDAKRNLASDPTAIARIDALARELGLEG